MKNEQAASWSVLTERGISSRPCRLETLCPLSRSPHAPDSLRRPRRTPLSAAAYWSEPCPQNGSLPTLINTSSKHVKGSKERYLLGKNTTCELSELSPYLKTVLRILFTIQISHSSHQNFYISQSCPWNPILVCKCTSVLKKRVKHRLLCSQ